MEGKSHSETAAELGLPLGTVNLVCAWLFKITGVYGRARGVIRKGKNRY